MSPRWRPLLVVLACVAVFGGLRLLRARGQQPPVQTQRDVQRDEGLPVELAEVVREPLQRQVRVFGTVRGSDQSEVVVPSPNILEKLHVSVGDEVRKGTVLARMRAVSVSPLGYPYGPARARKEALEADRERYADLHEQGAITEQQWDHFQAEYEAAMADFRAARATVQVESPIHGTVTRIDFDEGQMVPNDRPLLQVARLDPALADFMVEPTDIALVREDHPVKAESPAIPEATFSGTVAVRSLGALPVTGQYRVTVRFENPERQLLPGYPLRARIQLGNPEPVLSIPREAVVHREDRQGTWVADEGEVARFVPLEGVRIVGERAAVEGDLTPGDRVVTLGADRIVSDGQPLRPVDE